MEALHKLIPGPLASKSERSKADEKTVEQAARVKAHASALSSSPKVSTRSWLALREHIGKTQDRAFALQLVCSATGYQPFPKQLKFHLAGTRGQRVSKFLCCGIGYGKSFCAVVEDLIVALCNPGTRALVVAPTYDQALHVLLPIFLRLCEQMERAGFPILRKFRWSQMRAELVCGGEIFFRSSSKVDNLLGFEFCLIHFDECETVSAPERIWAALDGRMRQVANWREMIGTSTPRGLRGVIGIFHAAREDYKTPEEKALRREQYVFIRATTLENPKLPPDYVENLRRTLSNAQWRQEVLAEILRPEAAVYGVFERKRHEIKFDSREEFYRLMRETGTTYDLVHDPGSNRGHLLWIARLVEHDIVFDELCEDGLSEQRTHDEILKRCKLLGRNPDWVILDRAIKRERAWSYENLSGSAVQFMDFKAEQSIIDGIAVVTSQLDPMIGPPRLMFASYLWDRTPQRGIVKCMANYRYQQTSIGTLLRLPEKNNRDDHGADCIRYFCMKRYGEAFRMLVVQRRHAA